MCYMIGIRELRQNASKYLRQVQEGETVEVTDRGRPVARIAPIQKNDVRAVGRAGLGPPGEGRPPRPLAPLQPKPGVPLPSEILRRMREDER
jgi:prevent-host-death family protein